MQRDPGQALKALHVALVQSPQAQAKIAGRDCVYRYSSQIGGGRCPTGAQVLLYGKPYCNVHARQELEDD